MRFASTLTAASACLRPQHLAQDVDMSGCLAPDIGLEAGELEEGEAPVVAGLTGAERRLPATSCCSSAAAPSA